MLIKFVKWLCKRNGSEMIMADWLTDDETEIPKDDPGYKKLYEECRSRKQLDDNIRDLVWITIAVFTIIILTYYFKNI